MFLEKYNLKRKNNFSFSFFFEPKGLIVLFTFVGIVLLSAQLLIANKLATDGEDLSKKEQLTLVIMEENNELTNDLVTLGSLNTIAQKAEETGLVKVNKVEVITQVPFALVP